MSSINIFAAVSQPFRSKDLRGRLAGLHGLEKAVITWRKVGVKVQTRAVGSGWESRRKRAQEQAPQLRIARPAMEQRRRHRQQRSQGRLHPLPRKKTGSQAAVAEASSGGSLVAAPLAAGHVASCAGSASARNEEPGGGASLQGEQQIIASETAAAATAVKGTASATNKGNGRIASPRGEEEIQTSSSSNAGKIGA